MSQFDRTADQSKIFPHSPGQFFMCSLLDNTPMAQDYDIICVDYCAQTMRDDYYSPVLKK